MTGTSAIGYFDTSTLNTFTGTGTITMPLLRDGVVELHEFRGKRCGRLDTTASAALSVTYYYHIVPEPSSFVLTGLGVVGALGRRRGPATAARALRRPDPVLLDSSVAGLSVEVEVGSQEPALL